MLSRSQVILSLLSTLLTPASSVFTVQCTGRLFDQRVDPIVNPGAAAAHVHVITGANNFGLDTTYDQLRASSCSTCHIVEDKSVYWTPKMYYHAKNGSYIPVPVDGDNQYDKYGGGMAIYYNTDAGTKGGKITAFPPGFRMLAGDPERRTSSPETDFHGAAVSHQCNGPGGETQGLPNYQCDSIRSQIVMPFCWDGKNLDGVNGDHKSHVTYPNPGEGRNTYKWGDCPASHPVHLPALFFEVTYQTNLFKDDWYGNEQPFVFSNGDPTGYGFHGDFVNGWDQAALQKGLELCDDTWDASKGECTPHAFGIRSGAERGACRLPNIIDEVVDGVLPALPGCNPLASGPAKAVKVACAAPKFMNGKTPTAAKPAASSAAVVAAAPPATSVKAVVSPTKAAATPTKSSTAISKPVASAAAFPDLTKSKGYKYIGCGTDTMRGSRTLTGGMSWGADMTIEKCVATCKAGKFKFAGLEYGNQCFCGNSVAADRAPKAGVKGACAMPCAGSKTEVCGGPDAITLYEVCAGGACSNLVKKHSKRLAIGHSHHARSGLSRFVQVSS